MPRPDRLEPWLAFLITIALMVSIPVSRDGLGLGWDSMNHHVYLGWVANGARFEQDYFAAASQSYQFPYLYWPIYLLTRWRVDGWVAGTVWAMLHALVSIPLWMIANRLIAGETWPDAGVRVLAVLFGVGNLLVLRAPETTGNDVLAALPWLMAVAVGLGPARSSGLLDQVPRSAWRALLCGVLGGAAVALKLSNATVVIFLPLVCFSLSSTVPGRLRCAALCLLGTGMGFLVLYAWWGWQLWQAFGNPVFPFADGLFEPLRVMLAWRGGRG